jgi:hypothetical protein
MLGIIENMYQRLARDERARRGAGGVAAGE